MGAGFVVPGETGRAGHVFPSSSKIPDFHQSLWMDCKPRSSLEYHSVLSTTPVSSRPLGYGFKAKWGLGRSWQQQSGAGSMGAGV